MPWTAATSSSNWRWICVQADAIPRARAASIKLQACGSTEPQMHAWTHVGIPSTRGLMHGITSAGTSATRHPKGDERQVRGAEQARETGRPDGLFLPQPREPAPPGPDRLHTDCPALPGCHTAAITSGNRTKIRPRLTSKSRLPCTRRQGCVRRSLLAALVLM